MKGQKKLNFQLVKNEIVHEEKAARACFQAFNAKFILCEKEKNHVTMLQFFLLSLNVVSPPKKRTISFTKKCP